MCVFVGTINNNNKLNVNQYTKTVVINDTLRPSFPLQRPDVLQKRMTNVMALHEVW
jgi:hypothetical protein